MEFREIHVSSRGGLISWFQPECSAAGGHQALGATHLPRPPPQGRIPERYYTREETPMLQNKSKPQMEGRSAT